MMRSRVRSILRHALPIGAALRGAVAFGQEPGSLPAIPNSGDEGWSLDDIHDVCEATYFVAITIGIGVALWWYFFRRVPYERLPRLTFDVDVRWVGAFEGSSLIEVVAEVENPGPAIVDFSEFGYTLSAVAPGFDAAASGPLARLNALVPLIEGKWSSARTEVPPGIRRRFVCTAAIPETVAFAVATGSLMLGSSGRLLTATKLAAVGAKECD